jgi:hypothetical protein
MEIMTPEERRKVYPPFIVREIEKVDPPDFQMTKITDFLPMITCIWKISSKDYQERFCVRQEPPMRGDNFGETTLTFEEDAEAVLDQKDPSIEMTSKQREMLDKLFHLVEDYKDDIETPRSRYGENDKAIVNDPKWDEIRNCAKLVYEELSGDDLELWEKQRRYDRNS